MDAMTRYHEISKRKSRSYTRSQKSSSFQAPLLRELPADTAQQSKKVIKTEGTSKNQAIHHRTKAKRIPGQGGRLTWEDSCAQKLPGH